MASLYGVEQQIRESLDALSEAQENGVDFTDGEISAIMEYLANLESDKVDAIGFVVREKQSRVDFLKEEAERLYARAKVEETAITRLKNYVLNVLQLNGISRLAGRTSSMFVRKTAVVCLDNDIDLQKLPTECVCFIPARHEPDKRELAKQLKAGVCISGAWLEDRAGLIIR